MSQSKRLNQQYLVLGRQKTSLNNIVDVVFIFDMRKHAACRLKENTWC